MSAPLATVFTAIVTFIATNIDDLFILMLFFSQTNQSFRWTHVVAGQYIGFTALVLISLLGFALGYILPAEWIGLLGLVPIAIGIRQLVRPEKEQAEAEEPARVPLTKGNAHVLLDPRTFSVAAVTFANGGDNIGIYVPLFAASDAASLGITLAVFYILIAVLCWIAYTLTNHPAVANMLERYGHILVPFVLIALGIYIILENGTLSLFGL